MIPIITISYILLTALPFGSKQGQWPPGPRYRNSAGSFAAVFPGVAAIYHEKCGCLQQKRDRTGDLCNINVDLSSISRFKYLRNCNTCDIFVRPKLDISTTNIRNMRRSF
jgi:hypothetical protein